jgi:hypothetical protein
MNTDKRRFPRLRGFWKGALGINPVRDRKPFEEGRRVRVRLARDCDESNHK